MAEPLLEVDGLTRHFDLGSGRTLHAVDGVSFSLAREEILGLVGESGSGKSTLGKTLLGLLDKTGGTVRFEGETLPQRYGPKDHRRLATRMQMIFQDPYSSLNPRMTAGEIIGEGLRLHGRKSDREVQAALTHWLEAVGLRAEHAGRYPHEFSGGQRQRIGIARAMILEPTFVVCDEPISALDVSVQAQVVNLLAELKAALGLTLLFIAHDLSMVRYVSDRMAVMYLGSLIELGASDDVFFRPKHPYTQLLIASNPEPDPALARAPRPTMSGEIPSPVNLSAGCRFAGRCPEATDHCRRVTPPLKPVTDGEDKTPRLVACHLYP